MKKLQERKCHNHALDSLYNALLDDFSEMARETLEKDP